MHLLTLHLGVDELEHKPSHWILLKQFISDTFFSSEFLVNSVKSNDDLAKNTSEYAQVRSVFLVVCVYAFAVLEQHVLFRFSL